MLQIIVPFITNTQDSLTSISQVQSLLCCDFLSFSHSILALGLQVLKSCSQLALACMPRQEMS